MGRKAPKKYSKMDYFEKQAFTKDQSEKYGIDLKYETVNGRHEQVDWEASNRAVSKAMANDYDTRRSIEAAQLSGNKKAEKLGKGINNINDAVNAERFMAKTHANRLDATGKYSSANDEGNVTNYWVNKDRNKLTDSMSASNQAAVAKGKTEDDGPVVLSDQLQQAEDAVKEFDNKDYDVYNQGKATSDGDDQREQASQSFLDKYKMDLMSNMKPKLPV